MTQPDVVKVAGGVVIGAVVVALVMAMDFNPFAGRDKQTEVTLSPRGAYGGACELGKATLVRVGKSRQLSWEIANYCTDREQVVSVGNFRKTPEPVQATNCDNIGTDYPFEDTTGRSTTIAAATADKDGNVDPESGRIKLKVKGRNDLGETPLTYYFDVCLNGTKADPVLVIER